MPNSFFKFKQFTIHQDRSGMKVTTDSCLFGAWMASKVADTTAKTMVDLGAGTGLLSLMCAQKATELIIDAIELDDEASGQAKENFEASPWSGRINNIHADVRSYSYDKSYDLIVSNPPFYQNELKPEPGQRRLAHHEGFQLTELFEITSKLLSKNGKFFFLLPYKRNHEVESLMKTHGLAANEIVLMRQSKSHEPIRVLLTGSRAKETGISDVPTEEIVIRNGDKYSDEFVELLKDYYLYL
jgi:tRNA1Val (adenine37-N6)-methyltransferase